MSEDDIAELLKYSNSKELYIVTWNNLLKLQICPFKVAVIHNIGVLKQGQVVLVGEVKITFELKTVFIINGMAYFYYYFEILIAE